MFKEISNFVTDNDFSGVAKVSAVAPGAMSSAVPVANVCTVDWAHEQRLDVELERVIS